VIQAENRKTYRNACPFTGLPATLIERGRASSFPERDAASLVVCVLPDAYYHLDLLRQRLFIRVYKSSKVKFGHSVKRQFNF
jgi:hypothetical protein